jgi:tyrosyl-tRNA synthetase
MAASNATERLSLIKENLAEFLNPEIIESIVNEGRNPRIYWGNLSSVSCLRYEFGTDKGLNLL